MEDLIPGSGEYVFAVTHEELELISALVGMVNYGIGRPYREAAFRLSNTIDELVDDADFSLTSATKIGPQFEVHDPDTFDVIQVIDGEVVSILV